MTTNGNGKGNGNGRGKRAPGWPTHITKIVSSPITSKITRGPKAGQTVTSSKYYAVGTTDAGQLVRMPITAPQAGRLNISGVSLEVGGTKKTPKGMKTALIS